MLQKDISDNKAIGDFGAEAILKRVTSENVRILTHCNTGSLATAGYGTALGVIRSLHSSNKIGGLNKYFFYFFMIDFKLNTILFFL